jgi:hypothetical protein
MLRDKITNAAPEVLGLQALAHVAGDETLGPRFLALSGMDAESLKARAGEASVLAAVVAFLADHEADLVAVARQLGVTPETLAAAGRALAGPEGDWA